MNDVDSKDAKDWWKLGAVVALAIVLAGLGTIIASNYAPTPVVVLPEAGLSTTTALVQPTTTAAPFVTVATRSPGQPATSLPAGPAVLGASETIFDFGDNGTTLSFKITNSGGTATSWVIRSSNPSVTASATEGEIGPDEVVEVSVLLDRTTVSEGELDADLKLEWGDEVVQLFARGVHSDNPVIIGPKASPTTVQQATDSSCDPTLSTITVRVKDSSDIAEVIVRWSNGSSTTETPMKAVDAENYRAVIGPFTTNAPPNVKIVARDVHDNAGGASVSLTVVDCA